MTLPTLHLNAILNAGKPWGDKESGPYPGNDDEDGGHYDGDISEPYSHPPGEEIKIPPATSPSSDTMQMAGR